MSDGQELNLNTSYTPHTLYEDIAINLDSLRIGLVNNIYYIVNETSSYFSEKILSKKKLSPL